MVDDTVSFLTYCPFDALKENLNALLADLKKAKPASSKGQYVRKLTVSSTMGPGVAVDRATVDV